MVIEGNDETQTMPENSRRNRGQKDVRQKHRGELRLRVITPQKEPTIEDHTIFLEFIEDRGEAVRAHTIRRLVYCTTNDVTTPDEDVVGA